VCLLPLFLSFFSLCVFSIATMVIVSLHLPMDLYCACVVWCVWCGVVWCGVVWCGVEWCGVCVCVCDVFHFSFVSEFLYLTSILIYSLLLFPLLYFFIILSFSHPASSSISSFLYFVLSLCLSFSLFPFVICPTLPSFNNLFLVLTCVSVFFSLFPSCHSSLLFISLYVYLLFAQTHSHTS
jgi:hypothetical protein